jgi:hypothetical protein
MFALDGNPEPDLIHATGYKQPSLRHLIMFTALLIYRVSQEECARLWEGVPYGKVY